MALALHVLLQAAFIARILLRPHRDPASRLAWIVVVLGLPVFGMLGYLLLGETSIGRRRVARQRAVLAALPDPALAPGYGPALNPDIPARHLPLFRVGQSISGYAPVGGNRASLTADADATIRALVRSPHWPAMRRAGVRLARALPVGNPLLGALTGRIDLRDHRKVVVVDNRIAYCGSRNCADPEFRVKARYAPWVDAVMRFEGPVARQCQHLFAADWMTHADEDIAGLLLRPVPPAPPGLPAQVVASGPTVRRSAMPEMFQSLMYA